jgi:hypothetical protein
VGAIVMRITVAERRAGNATQALWHMTMHGKALAWGGVDAGRSQTTNVLFQSHEINFSYFKSFGDLNMRANVGVTKFNTYYLISCLRDAKRS